MSRACLRCGSSDLRTSRSRSWIEKLLASCGFAALRCRQCGARQPAVRNWWADLFYAHCPQCGRDDLTDWAEKYLYPTGWSRWTVFCGARRHRCESCRLNFTSFLPRRRECARPPRTSPEPAIALFLDHPPELLAIESEIAAVREPHMPEHLTAELAPDTQPSPPGQSKTKAVPRERKPKPKSPRRAPKVLVIGAGVEPASTSNEADPPQGA